MKKSLVILLSCLLILSMPGISPAAHAAGAEPVTVVCSFYPIRIFSENGFSEADLEKVLAIDGVEDATRCFPGNACAGRNRLSA